MEIDYHAAQEPELQPIVKINLVSEMSPAYQAVSKASKHFLKFTLKKVINYIILKPHLFECYLNYNSMTITYYFTGIARK